MQNLLLIALTAWCFSLNAQPDRLPAKKGGILLTPVLHATMALQWNGVTLYVDPYGGADKFKGFPAPDLVVITDIHGDHMNKETLQGLDLSKATLVAPKAVADELKEVVFKQVLVVGNGAKKKWKKIGIEALPMYNLPETADSRHPKGRGNGYVLTLGGQRLYISGDTEDIPEMRQLQKIDVAFVCMNQPFTMTVEQAADAVLAFQPKMVYPFHYRGREGLSDVNQFKSLVNTGNGGIEVRLRDWYPGD